MIDIDGLDALYEYANDNQREILDAVIRTRSIRAAARELGKASHAHLSETISKLKEQAGIQKQKPEIVAIRPEVEKSGKCYVLTTAVSACHAVKPFLSALEWYANFFGAELMVFQRNYKHKIANTGKAKKEDQYWFDPSIKKYAVQDRARLHKSLVALSDVHVLPTNSRPLVGLEAIARGSSAVLPHPRVQMRSVAGRIGDMPTIFWSTGCVTEDTYSETFAGAKGKANHCIAALVVHIDADGIFHCRHIHFDGVDGFYDLGYHYTGSGRAPARVLGITLGDVHGVKCSEEVAEYTWRKHNSILRTLKPLNIIAHDTLDSQAVSPHHGYFDRYALHVEGKTDLMREIKSTAALMDEIVSATPDATLHVIPSNHDDMTDRWLQNEANSKDLENAIIYHETKLEILKSIKSGKKVTAWQYWGRKLCKSGRVRFLSLGDSLMIGGVEHGYHGHKGANGAKGSSASFARAGVKTTTGHTHSPFILDGAYGVGACETAKDAGYPMGGLSGWVATHTIQYQDGHRTNINIIIPEK